VKHCIRRHPEAANRCSPEDGDDISVGGYVRQKRGTALCETEKVGRTYGSQPIRIFRVLCSTPRPALRSIGQNGVTTKILKQVDRSLRVVQALLCAPMLQSPPGACDSDRPCLLASIERRLHRWSAWLSESSYRHHFSCLFTCVMC
jgi:hypothetical protein